MAIVARSNRLLGAPGIFSAPTEPLRAITAVRRDVAAFLGVAPKGPARIPAAELEPDADVATWLAIEPPQRSVPTVITSWDEYRYHFGGFDGPGRLPYAVRAFFAGGGVEAWIVRIVHDYGDPTTDLAGRASAQLDTLHTPTPAQLPITLFARSEGRWGNRLRATMRFGTRPLHVITHTPTELIIDRDEWVPVGSTLRAELGADVRALATVVDSRLRPNPTAAGQRRHLTLAAPLALPLPPAVPAVELVTASIETIDLDGVDDRREVLEDLGMRPEHPRYLARVLIAESELLWPDPLWVADGIGLDDETLAPAAAVADLAGTSVDHFTNGTDRWQDIRPTDFFDQNWFPGAERPGSGVESLTDIEAIGLVLAPDLYEPEPLTTRVEATEPPTLCGAEFAPHQEREPRPPDDPWQPGLDGLALMPSVPDDLRTIVGLQRDLVAWAERRRDVTVLLDAPPGLSQGRLMSWRIEFDSSHAAAYHPWLDMMLLDDGRDGLTRVNPSAFAAGIVASKEIRLGVQYGPANEIAAGAVRVGDVVSGPRHDELHRAGINVFLPERDGIRLTGARTLSRVASLRQLSVARLMTVIRISIEHDMQWAVFEPNSRELWARVERIVRSLLTRLFEGGAFAGATTKEAFFVRCDLSTMTRNDLDNGRAICLVGVAPVEPIEYIELQIAVATAEGISVEVLP